MTKYLIWGTGEAARNYVIPHLTGYFKYNPITAFLDNNEKKEGTAFLGKKVCMPKHINELDFNYIVICSSFFTEISNQLNELGIKKEYIKIMPEMDFEILGYYNNVCKLPEKNILLIGNPIRYEQMRHEYEKRFNIIKVIDGKDLFRINETDWDYIMFMDNGNISCDYTITEKSLRDELISNYNVKEENLLSFSVFELFNFTDLPISYGNEYPDKTFLQIHQTATAGLGALIVTVASNVAYARENGLIPIIDFESFPNAYLEKDEVGKVNAWDKFFEQPDSYTVDDIKSAKNVIWSAVVRAGSPVQDFSFLKPKSELKKMSVDFCNSIFEDGKKVLGVLFRGTDYVNRKPFRHYIQPSLEEMLEMVKIKKEEWKMDKVYLCSEVKEAISAFKNEFSEDLCYYPQKRYPSECRQYLASVKTDGLTAYKKGCDYWTALTALSKCDSLIAGKCNGSEVALILNENKYKNVFIYELGRYGIDDI